MNKKRVRAPNYTPSESVHLCNIIEKYKDIIENKENDGATHHKKQQAWIKVAEEYNSTTTAFHRTVESLQINYKNIKRKAKKDLSAKEMAFPGGQPSEIKKEDVFSDKVCSIMGPAMDGIYNNNNGDSILMTSQKDSPQPIVMVNLQSSSASSDKASFENNRANIKRKPKLLVLKQKKCGQPSVSTKLKVLTDEKIELVRLQKKLILTQIKAEEERIKKIKLENDILLRKLQQEEYSLEGIKKEES